MSKKAGKKKAAKADEKSEATEGVGLPLFYGAPEVLDPKRHAGLGLDEKVAYGFTAKANAIPVNAAEFARVARDYPIVFIGTDDLKAAAVVGLRKNENLMVDSKGAWATDTYIPSYVRRYPFIFVSDESAQKYALCIDRNSERIIENAKAPFFDGDGLTQLGKNAMEFCTAFQREHIASEAVIKQLQALDLFVVHQGRYTLPNGDTLTVRDFKVIDEKRFNELPDDVFITLRKTGALAVVYCHLLSMNSWPNLLKRMPV